MRRRWTKAVWLLPIPIALAASCQEPTQVTIEARTNLVYRSGFVTSFTVGAPGETETAELTTETREPWGLDGFVGSLAVVPSTTKDAPLSVKVVLGVRRDARECVPPAYEGCIVARRKLHYVEGVPLRLPVTLYAHCEGVPCDAETTCSVLGQCISAEVDPDTCASPDGCGLVGEPPPSAPLPDASFDGAGDSTDSRLDATSDLDAPADTSTDAPPQDAAADGKKEGGGIPVTEIDCPIGPATPGACPLGSACCYSSATFIGSCVEVASPCVFPLVKIACDDDSDCPGASCCRTSSGFSCIAGGCGGGSPRVCHVDGFCPAGTCSTLFGHGTYYRACSP